MRCFRVLVVEEESSDRDRLIFGLEALGVDIQIANSAENVIEEMAGPVRSAFDLILADDSALSQAKEVQCADAVSNGHGDPPFVLMTEDPAPGGSMWSLRKPFELSELFDVVRWAAERRMKKTESAQAII